MIRTGFPFWKSCFFTVFLSGRRLKKETFGVRIRKKKVLKSKKNWRINYEKTSFSNYGSRNGKRYGGLKQIDPVDKEGHIIMDFPCLMQKEPDLRRLFLL